MGWVCPNCGEALPEDTPCPCGFDGDDWLDECEDYDSEEVEDV